MYFFYFRIFSSLTSDVIKYWITTCHSQMMQSTCGLNLGGSLRLGKRQACAQLLGWSLCIWKKPCFSAWLARCQWKLHSRGIFVLNIQGRRCSGRKQESVALVFRNYYGRSSVFWEYTHLNNDLKNVRVNSSQLAGFRCQVLILHRSLPGGWLYQIVRLC